MAEDFKRMKLAGKDRAWELVLAGVVLSYVIWEFRGSGALVMLSIIPTILLVLSLAVPRKHRPHIISLLAVGMGGTVVIGIVYQFGLNGPDIYGTECIDFVRFHEPPGYGRRPPTLPIPKIIEGHQIATDLPPGSDRPPSSQGRRHTAKLTNLVNLRAVPA